MVAEMNNKWKVAAASLTVSAAFFTTLISHEGYRIKPYIDSVGVPTIGIGNTVYPDGRKVKITDKPITKQQAIEISKHHVSKDEAKFKASIPDVYLHQTEYDIYLDFAYNFGMANWSKSSMRRELVKGNHIAACKALLKYKYAGGRDCSVRKNNCWGVWKRQLERYNKCIEVNQ